MSKYRVGIIGCGSIFPMHAISIKACSEAEIAAVCDTKNELAQKRAKEYECSAYTDYKQMLETEKLDAVHICLPHHLHAPVAVYCMKKGVHVLTEKPMASNLEDARTMLETAKSCGVGFACIFQNRFNHGNRLLKEELSSGRLGKIYGAKCYVTWYRNDAYYKSGSWRANIAEAGGGVIMNQAIHTIDAMRYLMDSKPVKISATIATRGKLDIEVEDTAEGLIEFENGVQANFHAISYYSTDAKIFVEFDCQNGVATLHGDEGKIVYNNGTVLTSAPKDDEILNYGDAKSYWGNCHMKQIFDFYNHLRNNQPMYISAESALETQELVSDIYESGRSGKTIYKK